MPFTTMKSIIVIIASLIFYPVETYILHTGCKTPGRFAITLDDGPHKSNTLQLLQLLQKENVKATFFVVGPSLWETFLNYTGPTYWNNNVGEYVALIRRIYDGGHQLGNHCWSHPHLTQFETEDEIRQELGKLADLIYSIIYKNMTVFRPPFGDYDDRVSRIAVEEFGYELVSGNVNTLDWSQPNDAKFSFEQVVQTILNTSDDSYISVGHEFVNSAVELTEMILDFIKNRGFKIGTVAECLGIPAFR